MSILLERVDGAVSDNNSKSFGYSLGVKEGQVGEIHIMKEYG